MNKPTYLECACSSPDHTLRMIRFEDTNEVFLSVHLTPYNWYKRIIVAIKYVLDYTSKYGHFEEIILSPETQKDFASYLLKVDIIYDNGRQNSQDQLH
jgi:hypothetical protein